MGSLGHLIAAAPAQPHIKKYLLGPTTPYIPPTMSPLLYSAYHMGPPAASKHIGRTRRTTSPASATPIRAPALPTPAPALLDSPRSGAPPAPRKTAVWTAMTPPGAMTPPLA
ncbi:uncharacterized protein F5147DRAFT_771326 [Suillus discolor]|uniref:Uncharacterized protein n=1 Tax=Suillus discolor TaxID=1912936 RepID=A0A9P7JWD4_9AGAM|nr:uncharacterized protein F5147DRAFT_771326 [Suillus discolor]KAG2112264.1 hypothetical protein F5147DRAFT_771326 [Suillus discolor]